MKKDLLIKIIFIVILIFSIYLIISGLLTQDSINSDILEEDLQISEGNITIDVGEKKQIIATIIPPNATYKNLTWESANPSIASVNNGLIVGVNSGNTVVKVVTEKRQITKIINVAVKEKIIPVTEINVKEKNIELEVGDTRKIEYEVLPIDATNKNVSFNTGDKNIVSFTQDGEIVGVSEGTTTVILKSNNDVTTIINVTVKKKTIPVTDVTLNKNKLTITVSKEETLVATIKPSNATNKNVIWESSDNNIATVNNGKVLAKKPGVATIKVKTEDGNKEATCIVTVKEKTPDIATPIVPSNPIIKYEGNTLKYYITNNGLYYLTYIWMQEPVNQIKKLEANTAKYGKVLKDSEIPGKLYRLSVGEMMNSYISNGILPSSKAAIGFNASGFYVKGAWNPPSDYYNNRSSSWFVMTDGIITRNRTDDNTNTRYIMVAIDGNGDLQAYDGGIQKDSREKTVQMIKEANVRNTWSFAPLLIKNGQQQPWGTTEKARRQGICQVNSNNYIMLSSYTNMKIDDVGSVFASLKCKTAFNLDGGGSTSIFAKKPGTTTASKVLCSDGSSRQQCRSIVEGIYFTEK